MHSRDREDRPAAAVFRVVLGVAYAASLIAVCLLLASGSSFYAAPAADRAHHPGYWQWKPGGSVGHALGWAGSGMMLLMLGYSLRKRLSLLRGLGALSRWLDVHIFLGIFGPLLIVLHSAFKVQGLVALSFWSMVVVALSGVLGRFLYLQIPRTRAGEALTLGELEAEDALLAQRLREEFGLGAEALARLDGLGEPSRARAGLLRSLAGVAFAGRELRQRAAVFARSSPGVPPGLLRSFERLAQEKARSRWRIRAFDRLQELFHYWHVFHKPFAVVMYLFMLVHVAVAIATGYGGVALP